MVTTTTGGTTATNPASYINLPIPKGKQAPPTFKGKHRELDRFLEHYKHVCAQYHVTESDQKCLGLITYCSSSVASTVENLPSFIKKDFTALEADLQWLYDGDRRKAEYHTGHLEEFARTWRKEPILDLATFKEYHRKYLKAAGALKAAGHIEQREFDRWFWAGLHEATRDRLERRMTDDEPTLDLSTPFPVDKLTKAAEHIFNRKRFDKFLREEQEESSRPKSRKKSSRRRRRDREDSSDESDSSDSEDDEPTSRQSANRVPAKTKGISAGEKAELAKAKSDRDEIAKLVTGMEGLHISDPRYRTYFTQLSTLSPESCRWYPEPVVPAQRAYLAQGTPERPSERMRDPPPHRVMFQPDRRFGDRPELTCYGCDGKGHRMDGCEKLDALITQGHIKRERGRICWKNNDRIDRRPGENWEKAILRQVQSGTSTTGATGGGTGDRSVYYVEVHREDSDADSDAQEDLGWEPGTTSVEDLKAYGVERSQRTIRDGRKAGQNLPPRTHRMKEFPTRGHIEDADSRQRPVAKNPGLHRGQNRLQGATAPTPVDISPGEFKGENDGELVPMDVEDAITSKRVEDGGKPTTRDQEGAIRNVAQARSKKGKTQSAVIQELLNSPLTICLKDLVSVSPNVRQGLVATLRGIRDDVLGDGGTARPDPKPSKEKEDRIAVMRVGESRGEDRRVKKGKQLAAKSKADPPTLLATIGNAQMEGIVDSGSMTNFCCGYN
jgi:hypothetical protein